MRRNGIIIGAIVAAIAIAAHAQTAPQHEWKRFEAENGAAYALDLKSILSLTGGQVRAIICEVDNDHCVMSPSSPTQVQFDCHGHYSIMIGYSIVNEIAPPRSVIGQIAAAACSLAHIN